MNSGDFITASRAGIDTLNQLSFVESPAKLTSKKNFAGGQVIASCFIWAAGDFVLYIFWLFIEAGH